MSETALLIKNPSLAPLNVLIGNWNVTMKHVAIANPLTWQDSITWLENAFILWHWQGKNEVPQAKLIIGFNENDSNSTYIMFYYDSRSISRTMHMTFNGNIWKFWREGSDFFQRFEGHISNDGNTIIGKGDISYNKGDGWEHDYDITYTRINSS